MEMGVSAPSQRSGAGSVRRTQAERRARTRESLLAATVAVLSEDGYCRLTTRGVAERAGVTPGALQHHFASKAELVAEAIQHLNAELTGELLKQTAVDERSERELAEQLLERLWQLYKGPLMAAMAELAVAARTDAELRRRLARVQGAAVQLTATAGAQLFPEAAARAPLAGLIDTALATLRGLALLHFVDAAMADTMWASTKTHLLELLFSPRSERRSA